MVQDYLVATNDGTVTGGDGTRGHRFWVGARHGTVPRGGVYILGLADSSQVSSLQNSRPKEGSANMN